MTHKLTPVKRAMLYTCFGRHCHSRPTPGVRLKLESNRLLRYWARTRQRGGMPLPARLQGVKESAGKAATGPERSEAWPCSVDDPLLASSGGHSTRQGPSPPPGSGPDAAHDNHSINSQIVKQPFNYEDYVMWYAERGVVMP